MLLVSVIYILYNNWIEMNGNWCYITIVLPTVVLDKLILNQHRYNIHDPILKPDEISTKRRIPGTQPVQEPVDHVTLWTVTLIILYILWHYIHQHQDQQTEKVYPENHRHPGQHRWHPVFWRHVFVTKTKRKSTTK